MSDVQDSTPYRTPDPPPPPPPPTLRERLEESSGGKTVVGTLTLATALLVLALVVFLPGAAFIYLSAPKDHSVTWSELKFAPAWTIMGAVTIAVSCKFVSGFFGLTSNLGELVLRKR